MIRGTLITKYLAVVSFFIIATVVCAKNQGKKTGGNKAMEKITLANKLVKRFTIKGAGDFEIAVGYILDKGEYTADKGEKRQGPVASLSIPQGGGKKPRVLEVGVGSEFRIGKIEFKVMEVKPGPRGRGYVLLQPVSE